MAQRPASHTAGPRPPRPAGPRAPNVTPELEVSAFPLGARITHDTFGAGIVTAIDGLKLTVSFDTGGVKKVVESFVKAA